MRVAKHQVFKLTQDVVAALRQMRQILLLRLICACGAQMGEREQQVDFFAQLRFIFRADWDRCQPVKSFVWPGSSSISYPFSFGNLRFC